MKGRFAPSPSGRMHLGNVYSAVLSWLSAKSQGGEWVLRIEDLDRQRCRREYAEILEDDLLWLGLKWDEGGSAGGPDGPYFQSERSDIYCKELGKLRQKNLLYPCYCTRADIMASSAPHSSDGAVVYSGRCRNLTASQRAELDRVRRPAVRMIVPDTVCQFTDVHYGIQSCNLALGCGDFIVRRADGNFAYQLAVVADDALMGITEVVRGCDLLNSTHQQIYMYRQLGYAEPRFAHIPLLMSADGHRLAKRDKGTDMGYLRNVYSPEELLGIIACYAGLTDRPAAISLAELIKEFSWEKVPTGNVVVGSNAPL